MTYPSIQFLFFSLFSILFSFFIPKKWQIYLWLLCSIIWISSWKVSWGILYLGVLFLNYLSLLGIKKLSSTSKNTGFAFLVGVNVVVFLALKIRTLGFIDFQTPYGTSFFLFMLIGYIIDLWRSPGEWTLPSFVKFLLFPMFFPALMGGPLSRGKNFFLKCENPLEQNTENTLNGLVLFAYGFAKFHFLSEGLNNLTLDLYFMSKDSLYAVLMLGVAGTLQAYIDFSSYCDMGRGIARCLGVELEINFRSIFFAKNPNDYWQRWNITLGTWIRDYISFPMMLKWGRKINQNILMIFSFILVGLWHGIAWNWLWFGIFNGLIVVSYNWINKKYSFGFFGRLMSWLIIVGNGLLQRSDFYLEIPSIIYYRFHARFGFIRWDQLKSNFTTTMLVALGVVLVIDLYSEIKQNVFWEKSFNGLVKGIVLAAFFIWIFWGLNSNLFIEDVILPPVYFKI